jgi:hypothetical protein
MTSVANDAIAVIVNNFGRENIRYIVDDASRMVGYVRLGLAGVIKMIEDMYTDPARPQNRTIGVMRPEDCRVGDPRFKVWIDGHWILYKSDNMTRELSFSRIIDIEDLLRENEHMLTPEETQRFLSESDAVIGERADPQKNAALCRGIEAVLNKLSSR